MKYALMTLLVFGFTAANARPNKTEALKRTKVADHHTVEHIRIISKSGQNKPQAHNPETCSTVVCTLSNANGPARLKDVLKVEMAVNGEVYTVAELEKMLAAHYKANGKELGEMQALTMGLQGHELKKATRYYRLLPGSANKGLVGIVHIQDRGFVLLRQQDLDRVLEHRLIRITQRINNSESEIEHTKKQRSYAELTQKQPYAINGSVEVLPGMETANQ